MVGRTWRLRDRGHRPSSRCGPSRHAERSQAPPPAVATADHQAQIDALSKQLAELKQTANVSDSAQAK